MPISGLVITLSSEPEAQQQAILDLANHPSITLGVPNGRRFPAAMDAPNPKVAKAFYFELLELTGIEHVDVVYVSFDDDEGPTLDATDQLSGSAS